jgi:Uma2 family endonuclease
MSTHSPSRTIVYPDSDGQPMSDNTLQFQWITTIVGGLMALYRSDPNVFIAGDLLWYPIEGDNKTRSAPDVMAVFGRPKGYRGSYMQWREADIAPQIVFEVHSPGNRFKDLARKLDFYRRFRVEEYYLINPDPPWLEGWRRVGDELTEIEEMNGWISPRSGIRFELIDHDLRILGPDGRPFETYVEAVDRADEERRRANEERYRADEEHRRADEEHRRADEERRRADEERHRVELLEQKMRALGIDPNA